MTADKSEHSHELKTLRSIMTTSQKHIYTKHIVKLLDAFLHEGPNGSHQCLGFELLGPTIDFVLNDFITSEDNPSRNLSED